MPLLLTILLAQLQPLHSSLCIYSPRYIERYPIVYIFTLIQNGWYSGYHQGYNFRGLDVYMCIYHLLEIHISLVYSHPQTLEQPYFCSISSVYKTE